MKLEALSLELKGLVATAGAHVVRVDARQGAAASGVVWSTDGVVVAAHHTLDEEAPIEVGLPSGEAVAAELVGRDPSTDLAVLRIPRSGLSAPDWEAPAAAAPGALVVALSRPGRSIRAELGMVSRAAGEWRAPTGGKLEGYLETSLPLRPGLSGSLLVGASGEPLGLVDAGLVRGVAMAIPVAALRRVVAAILKHGSLRRGYLGIATFPVRLPAGSGPGAGEDGALLVSSVEPESPAARAGLRLGDVLLTLAGRPVRGPHDLAPALESERIGETVEARILRGGEAREVLITIGARPRAPGGGR
jgi:S1-C subfamily serine protease